MSYGRKKTSLRIFYRLTLIALLAPVYFGLVAEDAGAQVNTGEISASVRSESGLSIPNAQVTLKYAKTGATKLATTDAAGRCVFSGLPPGPYEATVGAGGSAPRL